MNWAAVSTVLQSLAIVISAVAIYMTVRISRKQMLLEQRQLLLPLWENLQKLNQINPASPVWVDVTNSVNMLELIAICWEGEMVDQAIIRRMYGDLYIETYERISECKNPPANVGRDGRQMLNQCPAAIRLYDELKKEHANRGKLSPIN